MFNTAIKPINIVYRKPPQANAPKKNTETEDKNQNLLEEKKRETFYTEEGNKSPQAPSYLNASNTVNIAQIITDFRNTNKAINAPAEIQDEINIYLSLVEKESLKENPQKSIILSNLKNASRIF